LDADGKAPWLRATALTKVYGGVVALDSADFQIRAGEIRGLVGANGAGKSTLVKLLTGIVAPTDGEVRVDGASLRLGRPKESLAAGIVSVPQELTVAPGLTVAENVMLGHYPHRGGGFLREREMRRLAREVTTALSLEIPVEAHVGELPLIEQRLVMIARAFSFKARLVIFDEPTATIAPVEVDLLLQAIRMLSKRNVSILYVSHRLDEIVNLCSSVTVIRDGRVIADLGVDDATQTALVEHLAGADTIGADAAARGKRGDFREGTILDLRHVTTDRLQDISLQVRSGEIVALAGLVGSGAREILLAVCGTIRFHAGTVTLAGKNVRAGNTPRVIAAGVGFLPGDRSLAAFPSHTVRYNISLPSLARHSRGPFVGFRSERRAVAQAMQRVGLRRDPQVLVTSLSGGNQQKAIVARWIASGARLLLLDDPTAGVDVATRPEIHAQIRALCDAGAGVLLVSSDLDELVALADRVLVLDRGAVKAELERGGVTARRLLGMMSAFAP
jgi:ribose transport system ATP-binding protein